jgi:hypothetical protein
VAQLGGAGTRLEALLATQSGLALEQEREPFGMIEGAGIGMIGQFTEALSHAVEAEFVQ